MKDDYQKKFLGNTCEDKHSGFKGICDSITYFLNGCIRISLQPRLDKDDKFQDSKWFDVEQVQVVTEDKLEGGKRSGGPSSASIPSDMSR